MTSTLDLLSSEAVCSSSSISRGFLTMVCARFSRSRSSPEKLLG
ncbi:hypothetical protein [uncultured Ruminococcus sp.]|nr:hypothetical protein [uncultured Ruminococcus sp.]